MPLKRITITIPEEVAEAADRVAARLDRSRSWVLSDAARAGLELQGTSTKEETENRESPTGTCEIIGLDLSRRGQLESDLALTPTQRVVAAERTALLSDLIAPGRPQSRVVVFDSYRDYLVWDARERVRPA